ncbi:MAG: hypothetical protein ACJA2Q_001153, partial [Pseudohongiellaceae bacterium]
MYNAPSLRLSNDIYCPHFDVFLVIPRPVS